MNILGIFFYFLLALFLLVIVHEYGHFMVARLCGVKILRFSFGFGPILARWKDKRGTEYVWSLFPLGGYIKMLDEEEGPVADAEKHLAFNHKPIWAKMAIAVAGPLFNLLFAFFAFWLVLVVGIQSLAPIVDAVLPGSIAQQAGLKPKQEIIMFANQPVRSWRDFQFISMSLIGTYQPVSMIVKSGRNKTSTLSLDLQHWKLNEQHPDVLASLGITPFVPKIPPVVGMVIPHSPATAAGFKVGDVIVAIDGKPISDWLDLLDFVKVNPGKLVSIQVWRNGHKKILPVEIGSTEKDARMVGMLGIQSKHIHWPEGWLRIQRQGPIKAVNTAFYQTLQLTKNTLILIERLATGKVSLRGISGPVGIAQGASESARGGFAEYMSFLALISISLGILNLMPIPLLDGGHLLYYLIELIQRRPLATGFKVAGMYVGLMVLMALMALALTNDLSHLMNK